MPFNLRPLNISVFILVLHPAIPYRKQIFLNMNLQYHFFFLFFLTLLVLSYWSLFYSLCHLVNSSALSQYINLHLYLELNKISQFHHCIAEFVLKDLCNCVCPKFFGLCRPIIVYTQFQLVNLVLGLKFIHKT